MEYENYIRTAKLVWEEFTGNIKAELKNSDKKDQSTTIVVPPIRSLNECIKYLKLLFRIKLILLLKYLD